MPNTSRSTKKIKKVKFDKKQCFPGLNDIIVNNKDCGKKVYLEKKRKSKKSKKHKLRKHKYGGSRSLSRSRSSSRSRSRSRSRSSRSLSPLTRKTKKIRGSYSSPVKREPKTHHIIESDLYEGDDESSRIEEILNSPSTFAGDRIRFGGNNQCNVWTGDIELIDGKKTLVNKKYESC